MITIYAWDRKTRLGKSVEPSVLANPSVCNDPNVVVWINLSAPTPEEEDLVFGKFLPIHSLSLEDITRLRREPNALPHLPKVEEFPDYLFVIVNPLRDNYVQSLEEDLNQASDVERPFSQLSAVLTDRVLVTHHADRLVCIEQLRSFLERHQGQADRGPDYMFHLVLDAAVDQYAPVLDRIDDSLDDLEVQVIQKQSDKLFRRILRLKRQIILLRKTLIYQREVLVRLARGEFALVDERETIYYRNVYDHLVRFTELIESSREMTSDLLQSYLASQSNRLNQIMKVLTMISTIILPMSLVSGIYGMNFTHMPELGQPWGYPFALGLMGAVGIGAFGFFRWRKWI